MLKVGLFDGALEQHKSINLRLLDVGLQVNGQLLSLLVVGSVADDLVVVDHFSSVLDGERHVDGSYGHITSIMDIEVGEDCGTSKSNMEESLSEGVDSNISEVEDNDIVSRSLDRQSIGKIAIGGPSLTLVEVCVDSVLESTVLDLGVLGEVGLLGSLVEVLVSHKLEAVLGDERFVGSTVDSKKDLGRVEQH